MDILDRRPWAVRTLDRLDAGDAPVGALALTPLSALYALGARANRWLRRPRRLPEPPRTVAVGNLRVGGTGKTPVVADLAARWAATGASVAVVTRGYRADGGGDEPEWIAAESGARMVVDADRARGVARAAAEGAEVVLLDDAFQTPVDPSVRLCLVLDRDLRRPPRCLPAGPAREGRSALRRADALLVRVEGDPWPVTPAQRHRYAVAAADACGGRAFAFRLVGQGLRDPQGAPASDPGRVLLVSGLARPESFETTCRRWGLRAVASVRFEDHYRPQAGDAELLAEWVQRSGARAVVCPEKNLERLVPLVDGVPLLALRADLEWDEDPLPRLLAR